MPIYFHIEEPLIYNLSDEKQAKLQHWLVAVVSSEKPQAQLEDLNFILCTDDYLHEMNVQYLAHDTLTDVITFDHSEEENTIMGDVFISVERVKENALQFKEQKTEDKEKNEDKEGIETTELRRVMVHGLLHLLGYKDKSDADSQLMRAKENEYLAVYM